MTGIIRARGCCSSRNTVCSDIYTLAPDAESFRRFRGWIRKHDRMGHQAFGLILTGLRVIYVDSSGHLTQQGEVLAGVTEDMIR